MSSASNPSTTNYTIGKGVIYFDRFTAAGASTGYRDLGNAPAFTMATNVEQIKHYSSRSGIKSLDFVANTLKEASCKFSLDEINHQNLAYALGGDTAVTSQGDGNVGAEVFTAIHDRYVKLAQKNISHASFTIAGKTEGTDYTVDYINGMVKVLSTGTIVNSAATTCSYTFGAMTWNNINILSRDLVEGSLLFIGDTTVGNDIKVELWKVQLKLSGEISLITEEIGKIDFEGQIMEDTANHSTQPFGYVQDSGNDISES